MQIQIERSKQLKDIVCTFKVDANTNKMQIFYRMWTVEILRMIIHSQKKQHKSTYLKIWMQ